MPGYDDHPENVKKIQELKLGHDESKIVELSRNMPAFFKIGTVDYRAEMHFPEYQGDNTYVTIRPTEDVMNKHAVVVAENKFVTVFFDSFGNGVLRQQEYNDGKPLIGVADTIYQLDFTLTNNGEYKMIIKAPKTQNIGLRTQDVPY